MKTRLIQFPLLLLVTVSAWVYSKYTYFNPERAAVIVYGSEERPFVYRMLVPFCAWLLVQTGLSVDLALRIVVTLSAIGLFYALYYLLTAFRRSV